MFPFQSHLKSLFKKFSHSCSPPGPFNKRFKPDCTYYTQMLDCIQIKKRCNSLNGCCTPVKVNLTDFRSGILLSGTLCFFIYLIPAADSGLSESLHWPGPWQRSWPGPESASWRSWPPPRQSQRHGLKIPLQRC